MSSLDGGQYGGVIGGIIELIASNGYSDGNSSDTWWAKSKNGWHLLQRPTVSLSLDFHSNLAGSWCWLYISLIVCVCTASVSLCSSHTSCGGGFTARFPVKGQGAASETLQNEKLELRVWVRHFPTEAGVDKIYFLWRWGWCKHRSSEKVSSCTCTAWPHCWIGPLSSPQYAINDISPPQQNTVDFHSLKLIIISIFCCPMTSQSTITNSNLTN